MPPPDGNSRVNLPGQLRQPGPSLRYVGRKLQDAFLHDWLSDPQRFRPTTRMPRVFGLWNHLAGSSRQLAQQYEPLEIRGIVAYLRDRTQDPGPAATPAGITDSSAAEQAERGRVLFQTRGCLACHSHAAFADADKFRPPDEILAGPDLSNIADKLTSVVRGSPAPLCAGLPTPHRVRPIGLQNPGDLRSAVPARSGDLPPSASANRAWLADFIRQPTRHLPRTIMPDLLLEPIQNRDAAGQVLSVTDPAEDIAEFLLQHATSGYQPQPLPEIDEKTLDQLTLEYLRGAFHENKAKQYVERGIPSQLADTLQEAEKELIVPQEAKKQDGRQGR